VLVACARYSSAASLDPLVNVQIVGEPPPIAPAAFDPLHSSMARKRQ
jgi:hypothetical protein